MGFLWHDLHVRLQSQHLLRPTHSLTQGHLGSSFRLACLSVQASRRPVSKHPHQEGMLGLLIFVGEPPLRLNMHVHESNEGKRGSDLKCALWNQQKIWETSPPGQKYVSLRCPCTQECGTGQRWRYGHQKPLALRWDVSPARAVTEWLRPGQTFGRAEHDKASRSRHDSSPQTNKIGQGKKKKDRKDRDIKSRNGVRLKTGARQDRANN